MTQLIDDGERMIPEFHHDSLIYAEHIARYLFASQFVRGKRVLDIASGTGYGSNLMKQAGAADVVGVDYAREAVAYASEQHASHEPNFLVGDAENVPLRDGSFDVVVSFETVEHVHEHHNMLREMKRLLGTGGLLVMSTPNKGIYQEGNPFHLKEFTFEEFDADLKEYFKTVAILPQDNWITSAVLEQQVMESPDLPMANGVQVYKGMGKAAAEALYLVAICSDAPLPKASQQVTLSDVSQVRSYVEEVERQARGKIAHGEYEVAERDRRLAELGEMVEEKEAALNDRDALLSERQRASDYLWGELVAIRGSLGYRLLDRYRSLARVVFPPNSLRGVPYRVARKGMRLSIRSAGVIRREGLLAFARKARLKAANRLRRPAAVRPLLDSELALDPAIRPLRFRPGPNPAVTIIIPVYNKAVYTFNCLKSVLVNSSDVDYEIVVVDDGSTDETAQMLGSMDGIKVLTNPRNMGFLATCNHGLEAATGEFVVFLNNDTYVRKGWLSSLLGTIQKDPDVGIVGAKLIYPTGRLQEAGGYVLSDGTSGAYGRDDDPGKAEYNFVREVDYCCGACVIVRGDLLREIGGFDTRFSPAYYEDTDLAFAVRSRGFKVLYQPRAEIIHREGTSSGEEMSQVQQQKNRPIFLEKWREVLAREHLPPGAGDYLARARAPGKRVMVVDYHVPEFDRGGGEVRMFSILKLLREAGHHVTLLPADLRRVEPYTEEIQQAGIEVLYNELRWEEFGPHLDSVIVSRPEVAQHYLPLLRHYAPQAAVVYDTVDLHWVREARRAEIEGSEEVREEAERLKGMELWAARACDVTLVVSPVEKEILEQELYGIKVEVIPNIHPVRGSRQPFEERRDLLFVGYYPHLPNRDAVLYFIDEILPVVRKELPEVKFYVVGPEPGREIESRGSDDVVVTDWVKDLEPYLDRCRVFVCPLRYGAGIKGKIGQSQGYGLPVVTTTMGAEGMGLVDGENALISDDPAEFASRVALVYGDEALWNRLSENGLEFVANNYSPEVVRDKLDDLVQNVRGGVIGQGRKQCNVCGSRAGFVPNGGHPKEGFDCISCGSISRDRMLISALGLCLGQSGPLGTWQPNRSLAVLETSGFRAHPDLLDSRFRYMNLVYDDVAAHGVRGDLQRLPVQDESLDVVISAEVFEHVREDEKGFAEVKRVLKDGGFFVLQVPALGDGEHSRTLVEARGDEDVYLCPPEYHANNSLVYRYYGNDLVDRLARLTGMSVMLLRSSAPGNEIQEQALIVAQKSERLALGVLPAPSAGRAGNGSSG